MDDRRDGLTDPQTGPETVLWHLRWKLRGARVAVLSERVALAFWPAATIVSAGAGGVMLGALRRAPETVLTALVAGWAVALGVAVVRGALRLRLPRQADAVARLDRGLPGRPFAALADTQASGTADAASIALWQAHLARMARLAAAAPMPRPQPRLAPADPFALRLVALTLLAVGAIFGSGREIADAVPGGAAPPSAALAGGPAWEGWIQPPAYTGLPAVYLNSVTAPEVEVAAGSQVTLRLYGEAGAFGVRETVSGSAASGGAATGGIEFPAAQSGEIVIDGEGGRGWRVVVLPDSPPVIAPAGKAGRDPEGRFRQPFEARDDYGVRSGEAEVTLDLAAIDRRFGLAIAPEPRDPLVIDLPMPYARDTAEVRETLIDDQSKHPWANLPVEVRLLARDDPGQTGLSEPLRTELLGRRFFDPLAAAVIEARRDLLWSTGNAARTAQIMRAVLDRPEGFIRSERAFLRLRVTLAALEREAATGLAPETRDEIAEALWEIALLLEEGDLASALERLQRAQDRLDEAIREGADQSEIDQLMQEMREALQDYMRELAEQAEREGSQPRAETEGMQMEADQLQEMLDQLEQLMREGRMAEAAELMEMLRRMMENMQVTQGEGGQGQASPGEQAMRDLAETLREQQQLSDDAFRELQESFRRGDGQQGQQGQQPGQEGQQGQGQQGQGQEGQPGQRGEPGADGLAGRQRDLRGALDGVQDGQLPGEGTQSGDAARRALDRAGQAMQDAEEALREGDLPGALDRQAEALDALREGMRNLGEAMAEDRLNEGGEGEAVGRADPLGRRDPLGRGEGSTGGLATDDTRVPDTAEVRRRAEELSRELQRRSGELTRPEAERDYLRRLLDRF
jgi:uncharacterized protein (TIGR02302 family)